MPPHRQAPKLNPKPDCCQEATKRIDEDITKQAEQYKKAGDVGLHEAMQSSNSKNRNYSDYSSNSNHNGSNSNNSNSMRFRFLFLCLCSSFTHTHSLSLSLPLSLSLCLSLSLFSRYVLPHSICPSSLLVSVWATQRGVISRYSPP